ncbi:hypothetical protein EXV95_06885 [Acidovorax sp. JMULE5]|uniref:hypothetical protein n=1 Tax=Acidovorax sp. JMULE5 TaxID=2518343 RepID=UPI0015A082D4|nr:hypothetical protein [Acidovorax sp. JMULE5]QLA80386.1 hypothetical protein EXV95_06885 [Acidovorax sp. JMULE5]
MTIKNSPDLSAYRFSAGVDYVKLKGLHKQPLPPLDGKAIWPSSAPGKLTVHDATAADVVLLANTFPGAFIDELEVRVDIRTAKPLTAELQRVALKAFKTEFVAKRLMPVFIDGTNSGFRGAYDPSLKKTIPYNRRVPDPDAQLLMGHRNDGVQVKSYYKRLDQGKSLSLAQHCIRVEVRIGMVGLNKHGLSTIEDLLGFKYRRKLTQYFTHVSGSRFRKVRKSRRTPLLEVLHAKKEEFDQPHWERVGVGAFLPGGERRKSDLVFKRDIELNNRIGQALARMEQSFTAKKFVRLLISPNVRRPVSMRFLATSDESAITY